MIETWAKNGWRKIGQPVVRRLSFLPVGGWIALLVILAVGGRFLWAKAQAVRRDKIVTAFGRANLPCGVPRSSPDGTKMTYVQLSETGMAVFLDDLTTGHEQLIYEKRPEEFTLLMAAWPWSPDGRFFAYSADDLVVCNGDNGQSLARFTTDGFHGVVGLVWLNAERFICVNRQGNLHLVQRRHEGQWQVVPLFTPKIGVQSLCAISDDTIAWQTDNRIWTLNINNPRAAILYEPENGRLNEFRFSSKTGKFLVGTSEDGTDCLWSMTLKGSVVDDITCLAKAPSIHDIAWVGEKNTGFAYLSTDLHDPARNSLTINQGRSNEPIQLFGQGNIFNFSLAADDRKMFATGMVSNELAAGIWQYDLTSKQLQAVVPATDQPYPGAVYVRPLHGSLTQSSGRKLNYYVYPPANFDRHSHQKYPLVLGDTYYVPMDLFYQNRVESGLWAAALARCGVYVVIVERPHNWGFEIDRWGENVWVVYQELIKDSTIDTNNVFLFATSAETQYLREFEQKHPNLWAGVMHFDGSSPDLFALSTNKSAPRILLTAGEFEHRESELKRYQTNAMQQGMSAAVAIDPSSGHVVLGKNPLAKKNEAMIRFIFNE